ncbi:hypothetical protein [Streptomyces nogalater]|uniref:Uncharacterized protein n=1 Tax=Streptomyces nogalater TaxID=38314 RepID=A0ABW0WF03_STRNO
MSRTPGPVISGSSQQGALLVVPPDATPDAARAAMAQAVRADNISDAEQILIDTGSGRGPVR